METKTKIWSVAASVVAITLIFTCGTAFLFWRRLPPEVQLFLLIFLKEHFLYFFSFIGLLLIGIGLLLDDIIHIHVLPIKKMIEETTIISTINPAHRITPDGSPEVKRLARVINHWAELYQRLQATIGQEIQYAQKNDTQWPKVSMRIEDLISAVCRRAEAQLDVVITVERPDDDKTPWVKVDSYSIILALLYLVKRLKQRLDNPTLGVRIDRLAHFTRVDLMWPGDPVRIETLKGWQDEPLEVGSEGLALTLREVIGYHEAEIWSSTSRKRPDWAYLRLVLPASDEAAESDLVRDIAADAKADTH